MFSETELLNRMTEVFIKLSTSDVLIEQMTRKQAFGIIASLFIEKKPAWFGNKYINPDHVVYFGYKEDDKPSN